MLKISKPLCTSVLPSGWGPAGVLERETEAGLKEPTPISLRSLCLIFGP